MGKLSKLPPIISIFCIFFFIYHIIITVSSSTPPRYIAVEDITLDCGSETSGKSKGMDGRYWSGDFQSKFFPKEEHNLKSVTSQTPEESTAIKAPYTTARASYSQFTYVFPLTVGPKFVRLHFYPASYSGFQESQDNFTVKAGSFTLLRHFSTSNQGDTVQKKIVKEFCICVDEINKKLNITFVPFSDTTSSNFYAFINGIEIVSMPKDLYYSPEGQTQSEKIPSYVGESLRFYINYNMALQMDFRLNVGGSLILPAEDTGFFREWSEDINYFVHESYFNGESVVLHYPSLMPNYSKIENYTAPDYVYRSARTGYQSLLWELPVDSGFNYLVRLHFCEIDLNISHSSQSSLRIDIDYKSAEDDADVIWWAGNRDTPIYKDYVVRLSKEEKVEDNNKFLPIHIYSYDDYSPILNGVEVFKLINPEGPEHNLARPSPASSANDPKTNKTIFLAIGSLGFLVVLTSLSYMVQLMKFTCWRDPYRGMSQRAKALSLPEEPCRHFSLNEIRTATNNFHKELIIGQGGFGNVYKGLLDEGTLTVAIKRLNPDSQQGTREFKTEIKMLSQLRHVHLVSLIGYCIDEGEMILVYDYMRNGTLSARLFDTNNDPLTWKQRLEICLGAARGLHYLHTGMKNPIIHRDVKTTNILLDEKWVPKVSDFGLSKMGLNNTAVSTLVKGTWGYLDPDYARRQQLTDKSDVYSFGVVMFEVLCGRKALNTKLEHEQWHLANWARKCIEKGTIDQIIDPYLKGKIAPECFKVYVEVAESCVRDQGIQRPKMNDVMEKLEFAFELQQNADAAQEEINPSGVISYQDVLSFHVVEPVLESDSCIELTTSNSELTNPSLDSDGITSTV
ncbi:receptor-like protein kinase FERONIA [Quercus robur]|uniref:receptor-like protein kinase FERONIA n=1 Tax=Quercus robur TaxID=38942 RepID=UPI0021621A67|nr:receptor-like protein kinase FERONIA [Quercus robur]